MFFVGDWLWLDYLDANEKYKLSEVVNKKKFKVSDTPLSYRQTNSLDKDNLLPNNRDKEQGWRRFSLKELAYVLIVHDLKKFGIKHSQLRKLWRCFFGEPITKPNEVIVQTNKNIADMAIGLVMIGVEIFITFDSTGEVRFFDPGHFLIFDPYTTPQITFRLNDVINNLFIKIGKKPFPITVSIDTITKRITTPKEGEIIDIIRNEDYSAIKIKKDGNENFIIHAEKKNSGKTEATEKDILKMLQDKDFQDITIIKRDGKIVNFKIEETIKV